MHNQKSYILVDGDQNYKLSSKFLIENSSSTIEYYTVGSLPSNRFIAALPMLTIINVSRYNRSGKETVDKYIGMRLQQLIQVSKLLH